MEAGSLTRGSRAWLLAALAVLAVLLTARDGAAARRLPALDKAIEVVPFATCRLAVDDGDRASRRSPLDGSSVFDVDPPPPAIALPRTRSGPDGKPGAKDVVGADGLAREDLGRSGVPGSDPESGAHTAPLRDKPRISRRLSPHVAPRPSAALRA